DGDPAMARPDVVAVVTGRDPIVAGCRLRARSALPGYVETEQPILAWPETRFCGEAVAAVVASDRYAAEDAAERVAGDCTPLPAAAGLLPPSGAVPVVHAAARDNVLLSRRFESGDVERGLSAAAVVVERSFRTNRQTAAPLEGRAGVAEWSAA